MNISEVDTTLDFVKQWIEEKPYELDFPINQPVTAKSDKSSFSSKTEIVQQITLAELCVQRKSLESLKLLLENGCSTKGLIHVSIREKVKNIFTYLIEFGVDLDEYDRDGKTPLVQACETNLLFYVRALLDHGADPSLTDLAKRPNLPLSIACDLGNVEIVKLLLEAHSPTTSFDDATVPLLNAVRKNHTQIVYLLLQYGADPNYHGMETNSAFDQALANQNLEIIRVLVACGCDIQKVENRQLPKEIDDILKQWVDPELPYIPDPNPYLDIDAKQKQLVQELQQTQGAISKFITESRDIDFEQNYMTPTLNLQNQMLVSFVKFAKKMDFFGKALFMKRIKLLAQQYDALCEAERLAMEKEVAEDEKLFAEVFERSKVIVSDNADSFRIDAIPSLETMTAQLPKRYEECLPKARDIDPDVMRMNRSYLVYLNQILTIYTMNVTEIFRLFDAFGASFIDVLETAVKALDRFRDTLIEVRQTSLDIVVDPKWAKESKVDETCVEQCQKIQIDRAFICWEEEKFNSLKAKLDRCLRQAMH